MTLKCYTILEIFEPLQSINALLAYGLCLVGSAEDCIRLRATVLAPWLGMWCSKWRCELVRAPPRPSAPTLPSPRTNVPFLESQHCPGGSVPSQACLGTLGAVTSWGRLPTHPPRRTSLLFLICDFKGCPKVCPCALLGMHKVLGARLGMEKGLRELS